MGNPHHDLGLAAFVFSLLSLACSEGSAPGGEPGVGGSSVGGVGGNSATGAQPGSGGSGGDAGGGPAAGGTATGGSGGEHNDGAVCPDQTALDVLALPEPSDFVDLGLAVDTGAFGSWDTLMEGYTPAAVVQKDGTFYLYYIGSDDYIADLANIGPAHRSLGVAASGNGIVFTKPIAKPVLTFSSAGNPEEGVVSAGMMVDNNGEFLAYAGTNIAPNATSSEVWADVRLSSSSDGKTFGSLTKVIDHSDASVWGYGDEIHGTLALRHGDRYHVFYTPNGTGFTKKLGVCSGTDKAALSSCTGVTSNGTLVDGRGAASAVKLDETTYAFFLRDGANLHARTTDTNDFSTLSDVIKTYPLEGGSAVIFGDRLRKTWFLYYDRWTHIGVKVAPAGERDMTPPSAPPDLEAASSGHDTVTLTWGASVDCDTGIRSYEVRRGGKILGTTSKRSYVDSGLSAATEYSYEVRATNLHGTQGAPAQASCSTDSDKVAPSIVSVTTPSATRVRIVFDEPITSTTAQSTANYSIAGVSISAATLEADTQTVTLTTSTLQSNQLYTLGIAGISDRSPATNTLSSEAKFTHAAQDLVGYWRLDDASVSTEDTSGYAHHGATLGSPGTATGRVAGALTFGGRDYIEIQPKRALNDAAFSSFTVAAWVRASRTPPATDNANGAFAIFSGPDNIELKYDKARRFVASIRTSTGTTQHSSTTYDAGTWHHVAMVVDGTQKTLALHVDGQLAGGAAVPFTGDRALVPQASPNYAEYYGKYRIGVFDPLFSWESNYFEGSLDDVRFYGRALGSADIGLLASM
jgi:hypothetical protein